MSEVRKCGTGGVCCDGQCWKCFKHSVTISTTGEIIVNTAPILVSQTIYYPQVDGITPSVIGEWKEQE